VHTVDDEGFVCDSANEMSPPPLYAYWVRFIDVREARAAGSGVSSRLNQGGPGSLHAQSLK
jgi:hypothetical protein